MKVSKYTLLLVFSLFPIQLFSNTYDCSKIKSDEDQIDALIQAVSEIKGTFIRNGEEHNAVDAAKHLRTKLENAKKSPLSWGQKWTAAQFIDQLGTKSSVSGLPYEIKWNDGKRTPSGPWLHGELKKIKTLCFSS